MRLELFTAESGAVNIQGFLNAISDCDSTVEDLLEFCVTQLKDEDVLCNYIKSISHKMGHSPMFSEVNFFALCFMF